MIAYAKSRNIADSVETTTNGSLLSEARAREIIKSGLDKVRISVAHVSNSGYKRITSTYSDYEAIKRNVEFLFREKNRTGSGLKVHVKIIDVGLSKSEKVKF